MLHCFSDAGLISQHRDRLILRLFLYDMLKALCQVSVTRVTRDVCRLASPCSSPSMLQCVTDVDVSARDNHMRLCSAVRVCAWPCRWCVRRALTFACVQGLVVVDKVVATVLLPQVAGGNSLYTPPTPPRALPLALSLALNSHLYLRRYKYMGNECRLREL